MRSLDLPQPGIELNLFKTDSLTGQKTEILKIKIAIHVLLDKPELLPSPPSKPYCISIQNAVEIDMQGELIRDATSGENKKFMTRTLLSLPTGWECIEIFPFFAIDHWKSEFARTWAENDILASVLTNTLKKSELTKLDPKAPVRKQFASLLKKYEDLLNSNPEREEELQIFLKDNPMMLLPTHINIWPKLPLGSKKTDFVFKDATGDFLLVELERPDFQLFLKNGHPSRELNHAKSQITDWKRYIEDNLSTVQRELGLAGISANPNGLIVIGRSKTLTDDNRRLLSTMENESPKIKIMTYDDLLLKTKSLVENLLGPLWITNSETEVYYL